VRDAARLRRGLAEADGGELGIVSGFSSTGRRNSAFLMTRPA
jgi:hypothetical protein